MTKYAFWFLVGGVTILTLLQLNDVIKYRSSFYDSKTGFGWSSDFWIKTLGVVVAVAGLFLLRKKLD